MTDPRSPREPDEIADVDGAFEEWNGIEWYGAERVDWWNVFSRFWAARTNMFRDDHDLYRYTEP